MPIPPPREDPAADIVTDASGRIRAHLDPNIPLQNSPLRAGLLGPLGLTTDTSDEDDQET